MNRLRKKSDTKRPQYILPPLQTTIAPLERNENPQILPELPPADDFRTSLILSDLTHRFSLLRNSSGEPLPVDLLRSRLAEQRALGLENHISEEEEDMILENLGLRTKYAASADKSQSSMRLSARSSSSGRSTKRYSNNLFGSGRLRDYSYSRSAASQNRHTNSRTTSAAPSEVFPEARPDTPENDVPNDKAAVQSASLIPAPFSEQSPAEYTPSKSLSSTAFKRASLALEEVIRELEEDAEDEVVLPRSTPITRANGNMDNSNSQIDVYEAGMAISSDHHDRTATDEKRMSPVPSHILPGYVPGMPRPMTPREDMESDVLRSHSITPRAAGTSGANFNHSQLTSPSAEHAVHHSFLSFSRQSGRPTSPPFLQRSPADPTQRGERNMDGTDFDSSVVSGRKRPASPLSGPSYQPFTAAAVSTSRPSTPSNVTWTIPTSNQKVHNRSGSWFSDAEGSIDPHGGYTASSNDHSKSSSRSLRSPALPDSPILERSPTTAYPSASYPGTYDNRPPSIISGIDLNSPVSSRYARSPTPTQSPSRSPISPTFSTMDVSPKQVGRRSSKQSGSSSIPFSLPSHNPVLFSPIANSSHSSLESTGSSYHTWEADSKFLFVDADSSQPAWHDLSFSSQYSSTTPGSSPDTESSPEDVIGSYAGLLKSDFSAIQEKLVSAVASKNSMGPEPRERTSSLRRRRPSTSQSNYSLHRIATPPPQQSPPPQSPPPDGASALNTDISKASALLNSVLDSIKSASQDTSPLPPPVLNTADLQSSPRDVSPATRRNRDLAEVLFGPDENTPEGAPTPDAPRPLTPEDDTPSSKPSKETDPMPASPSLMMTIYTNTEGLGLSTPSPSVPYNPLRSPSTPHIPQTPEAQQDLTREVQRKTEAAMIALRKRPSNPNLSKEGLVSPGSIRKKIYPNQISTPTLLSASTSVDTIPLRTPPSSTSSGPPSKIGSRFKKLRGTLRKGNLPMEEIKVTPYPLDMRSNPSSSSSQPQFARYDTVKLHPIEHSVVSATEISRFQVPSVPVPSPPASAGPGLKGFMARFRGKGRTTESVDHKGQQHRTSPYQMQSPSFLPSPSSPLAEDVRSPRDMKTYPSQFSSSTAATPQLSQQAVDVNPHETLALKQLFNAANDLGLDQGKLSELLVRSGSISSKSTEWTMLTRNNSSVAKSRQESRDERQYQSPTPQSSEWSTFEDPGHRTSKMQMPVSRKSSLKQNENIGVRRPRQQRGQDDTNTIVRRTIIYPEDRGTSVADLNALVRKGSSRRRRASAISVTSSNRSLYERAPTPPPPRSPTGRRFSTEESPPVPQLPQSWAARMDKGVLGVSATSGQAYDSVYDMYSEKGPHSVPAEAGSSTQEPGPALEVIELANGETIWSIVNGLRDDDAESLYAGRSSFQSDFDDDMQVLVRERSAQAAQGSHERTGSKGSNSSFLSRKKITQGKSRPETKVFYTSSAQIGRLIENLSQGMDAGTFNFSHGHTDYSPSATSSMTGQSGSDYLTVEERLEHMLGAMKTA